jgi:hypothetical protein
VILDHYAPIVSAYWSADSYGWSLFDVETMMKFVSLNVYTLRQYGNSLPGLDARF